MTVFNVEQEKALTKLREMKVFKLRNEDVYGTFENEFDELWWTVLHEYDLYMEGEVGESIDIEERLCKSSAIETYEWLVSAQSLTSEFKTMSIK